MYPSRIRTGTRQDRLVATIGPPDFFPPTISFRILSSTQPRHTEETGTKPPPVPVTLFFLSSTAVAQSSRVIPYLNAHTTTISTDLTISSLFTFSSFFRSCAGAGHCSRARIGCDESIQPSAPTYATTVWLKGGIGGRLSFGLSLYLFSYTDQRYEYRVLCAISAILFTTYRLTLPIASGEWIRSGRFSFETFYTYEPSQTRATRLRDTRLDIKSHW